MQQVVQKSSKSAVEELSRPWPPCSAQRRPARPHTLPLCPPATTLACFCPCTPCNQTWVGVYRARFLSQRCLKEHARPARMHSCYRLETVGRRHSAAAHQPVLTLACHAGLVHCCGKLWFEE